MTREGYPISAVTGKFKGGAKKLSTRFRHPAFSAQDSFRSGTHSAFPLDERCGRSCCRCICRQRAGSWDVTARLARNSYR